MGFSYPGKFKSLTINAGSYYDCDGICRKTLTHVEEVQEHSIRQFLFIGKLKANC